MKKLGELTKKPWFLAILVGVLGFVLLWNIPVEKRKYGFFQDGLATDYTGLLPKQIERVVESKSQEQLQEIVQKANQKGQHISVAGLQHSQGGHTYYEDGVVLDMRPVNEVLEINKEEKTVKVEAGATWEEVQEAVQPLGFALQVSQSQAIFTIGGSLSVNAHGRDIRFGPMASTVKEMTVLTPVGDVKKVTRADDEEWMRYVLGGYGLFGVILDVTLKLTDNEIYTIHTEELSAADYPKYFDRLLDDSKTAMHYARVSVAPSSFLEEMYVIDYRKTGEIDKQKSLKGEEGVRLSKIALDLGRQGGIFEDIFWSAQKKYIDSLDGDRITRNNAMRSESNFMEFTKPGRVEVLQEFFVPLDEYKTYLRELKQLLPSNDQKDDFQIHNITVRYAAEDQVTSLNYAQENMVGLVVLIQHGLQDEQIAEAESLIQDWTDLTLEHGGTYYLPYYRYQSREQFQAAYPNWKDFLEEKLERDPNEVFRNMFYDYYLKEGDDDE
ncbi:FAD-binding oxidoreductase [Gracilibacillus sp. YIM 98692]|uniref:FAD-binding oxidoreductase n=1 Tax=Gracilibacillus sp. YIM 98692 TaxID=2663532 RepID=UPI0013D2B69E|nr:FAD-binding oxidoreductase [Gracilibacillus sp. YIM 98692]